MTASSSESTPLWSLSEKHLKALSERGTIKAYPKNTVIVNEGNATVGEPVKRATPAFPFSGPVDAPESDET